MKKPIKKVGLITSGGDAPGMNAAIRAVVRACSYYKIECLGFYRGYQGIIEDDYISLDARSVKNIISKGGTILKSARSTDFRTKEGRKKAYQNLKKAEIDGLILIGGDGTFTGGVVFGKEYNIPFIGIPGTIDNDIAGTSFTIGYDTALNTVVDAIDKIRDTASSHNRAEEILIPEEDLGLDRLLESLKKSKRSGKTSSIVVVSEGDKIGKNVFELAEYVSDNLPDYEARVSVLGHMQRGGSPSCFDRVLASRLGVKAVEELLDGKSNEMVGLVNNKVVNTNIEKAIKTSHDINRELLRISDILSV